MNVVVLGVISIVLFTMISVLVLIGNRMSKTGKLTAKQKNWWLISHIFFVILAFSGLIGQLMLVISTTWITDKAHFDLVHLLILLFDDYLIIPGSFGALMTGVWLSVRTNWGFTSFSWIIIKWVVNILAILMGVAIIGGRIHGAFPKILATSIHPLQNPAYFESRQILVAGIFISLAFYGFLVIISYLKPWGKRV